jgi:hypothetical protein
MATRVGLGSSRQSDSFRAGQEAAKQALEGLGQNSPNLIFLFASVRFEQEVLLQGVLSITGQTPLIGCSSAGEILPEGPAKRSLAVMAIASDQLHFATGIGRNLSASPRRAGQQAAFEATRQRLTAPHGLLMFPDGLTGNVAEVVRGIQDVLGLSFPIVGGSSADDFRFAKTFQYYRGQLHSDSVPVVQLAGPIEVGIGARHGWQPLGKPRQVTRALDNVVQELDGHTAVNIYETYFGKAAAQLKAESLADMSIVYPLGMPIPGEEEYLLRNVLRVDDNGSLVYAGEIPEGTQVRLMMGSKAKALEAARRAAQQAMRSISPRLPSFALVFSSCSRSRLFGPQAGEEIALIRRTIGGKIPLIGFYDYGEQAPLASAGFRGQSYLHNESLVICVVSAS